MTNYEYYKEQFDKTFGDYYDRDNLQHFCFTITNDKIVPLGECGCCPFENSPKGCADEILEWLNSEYKGEIK